MKWEFAVLTVLISVRLTDSATSLGTDYRAVEGEEDEVLRPSFFSLGSTFPKSNSTLPL